MEIFILILFAVFLAASIIFKISILYALGAGFILFFVYALKKGFTFKQTLSMSFEGVKTVKNILITFLLIGLLTGLWRAAGTIPSIVNYASGLFSPGIFILLTFLLNCLISFLTGTAFGTAATMGAICMTLGLSLNMDPVLLGGATLSGAYFGDRCSTVSTSALLVSEITHTDIFKNIKSMFKTGLGPLLISCAIYLALGFIVPHGGGEVIDVTGLFSREFALGLIPLIPAVIILIMALFKVNVKWTMLASIVSAVIICLAYQQDSVLDICKYMLLGYSSADPELAAMIDGGGVVSMIRVAAIVCLSSSYTGIFKKTGLLDRLKTAIEKLAKLTTSFTAILPVSLISAAVSCNQTLTIMLTQQLCDGVEKDNERFAIHLENSAVVVAPLIPWSIACGVVFSSIGAPTISIIAACYLYVLPLWSLAADLIRKHRQSKACNNS